jgi:hypothetical protein
MTASSRDLNNKIRALEGELNTLKQALAYVMNIANQTAAAHNALQGTLIGTGILSESLFEKPKITP